MDLNSVSPLEIFLFILFLVYLVFPVPTPPMFSLIDSSVGMLVVFMVTLYLFFYTNPVLGVLSIFVAYELLRRSSIVGKIIMNTPSQERNMKLNDMNPPPIYFPTLEEEVVSKMAPIGKSEASVYQSSSYKPVSDKLTGGSVV